MNLFSEPDLASFTADLIAAVDAISCPKTKVDVAIAKLALFLDARSYCLATLEERLKHVKLSGCLVPHYEVPNRIFVRIQPAHGNGLVIGQSSSHEILVGDPFSRKVNDDHLLIVEGAEVLFKQSPHLKVLCEDFASYLKKPFAEIIQKREVLERFKTVSNYSQTPPHLDAEISGILDWSPMAQAFKSLDQIVNQYGISSFQLRWVWISTGRISDSAFPYIYLQESNCDKMPVAFNKEGTKGIVHDVLQKKAPQLLWNYVYSNGWNHPEEAKRIFIEKAKATEYPHMLYFPITERLAAQITFSPKNNLLRLQEAGRRLVELAPIALLNGVQKFFYSSFLRILWDMQLDSGNVEINNLKHFLQFANNICPMPPMKVATQNRQLKFEPMSPDCPFGRAFAEHTNYAIEQARHTVAKMSETENLKVFGRHVMGMTHTHIRPLHNMKSFVQSVMAAKSTTSHLAKRSKEMDEFLDSVRIFADLDVEALKVLFQSEEKSSQHSRAADILAVFKRVNYGLNCSLGKKTFSNEFSMEEPFQHGKVFVKCSNKTHYSAPAGPLALIAAELIDNATKYKSPKASPVEVLFNQNDIIVLNSIQDRKQVEDKLNRGRQISGKSLSKVFHIAQMIGFNVEIVFPSHAKVEIKISPKIL